MSFKTKSLITVLVIVGFDAAASYLSRVFQFDYAKLTWLSFFFYVVVGYLGAHRQGFVYGMLLGAIAGFVDSTIGWFVSRMFGAYLRTDIPVLSPVLVVVVIVVVTATGFLFGSVGAALCKLFGQTRAAEA